MSNVLQEVLGANQRYAADFGGKAKLAMPPARRFAILTCMDARLDPAKFAGLAEGDAHVIRNAGGRASDDAIRSLVISYKLLGTREWFVIHHTNCGMEFFTNDVMRGLLANSLETAALTDKGFQDVGKGPGSRAGEYIEWLTIRDQEQSVRDDVQRIREHPLVPKNIAIWSEESPAWDVPAASKDTVIARYSDEHVLASGWLLGEAYIKGRAALVEVPIGQGEAVLFGLRPQYRAQSYQAFKLFFNSLVSGATLAN